MYSLDMDSTIDFQNASPEKRIEYLTEIHYGKDEFKKRIEKVYAQTEDKWIEPGHYTVTEADYGGIYDEEVFHIEVVKGMNLKDIALELIKKKNYMSPWDFLVIKKRVFKGDVKIGTKY